MYDTWTVCYAKTYVINLTKEKTYLDGLADPPSHPPASAPEAAVGVGWGRARERARERERCEI